MNHKIDLPGIGNARDLISGSPRHIKMVYSF